MKYTLEIYDIHNIGQRDNQEDSLFPSYGESTENDRLFLVCDGMGGHSSGEVASRIVCDTMSKCIMLSNPDPEGVFTKKDFDKALSAAFDELDRNDDGAYKKMGTTMTFLKFHSEGVTVAHIGDSRVYHIRPGKTQEETIIVHQTYDHSLVNGLVRAGEITQEEAKTFSRRNQITRAMQSGLKPRPLPDFYEVCENIQPGDYFMLCSDGVLEEIEDDDIKQIFSDEIPTCKEKRDRIEELIKNNKDNQTAIIIRVKDVVAKRKSVKCNNKQILGYVAVAAFIIIAFIIISLITGLFS